MTIPALTLMQPWATLIALGKKRIETRGWHPVTGTAATPPCLLAIASSGRPITPGLRARIESEPFASALNGAELPRGSIVALARVDRYVRTQDVVGEEFAREEPFGDFRPGRWAWRLGEVVAIEPVRVKGARSVWELPPDAVEAVTRAVGGRGELRRLAGSE